MPVTVGQLVKGVACLAALVAGWFFLAPTQLGGWSSYVITDGTSMQPRFHSGDLAVVRGEGGYHAGEILAYRNAMLGGHTVLHRIIRIDGSQYIFKGDNNSFIDSFEPTRSQLLGRLWFRVPAVGGYLRWFHGQHLFLAAGLLALLLLAAAASKQHRMRGRRSRSTGAARSTPPSAGSRTPYGRALSIAALVALVVFAALAAESFTRPLSARALRPDMYSQTGRFSYDAHVPGGAAVYGRPSASTGQPLFLRLVHSANFHFLYRFQSQAQHQITGRVTLAAQLSATDGWQRSLQLAQRPFSGDQATISGLLDLRALTALLDRVGQLSNATNGAYTLTLQAQVQVQGTLAGNRLNQSFAPSARFLLDSYQLQLQPGSPTGPGGASQLAQSSSGSGTLTVGNQLSLLKLHLPVAQARRLALLGGAAALLLLLAALALARRHRPLTAAEQIQLRYRDLIVPVTETPHGLALPSVTVGSIDGLVRIAEQSEHLILHLTRDGGDVYFVEHDGFLYTYRETERTPGSDNADAPGQARVSDPSAPASALTLIGGR